MWSEIELTLKVKVEKTKGMRQNRVLSRPFSVLPFNNRGMGNLNSPEHICDLVKECDVALLDLDVGDELFALRCCHLEFDHGSFLDSTFADCGEKERETWMIGFKTFPGGF